MPEFLTLIDPDAALSHLFAHFQPHPQVEKIPTVEGLGRVTAEAVPSPHPLPAFRRSTVDGYAVRARDTHGASESLPAYLPLTGEVPMGDRPSFSLMERECALIHTGGMLPEGADAVVMVEHTQSLPDSEIEILRAAAVGENVIDVGEDIQQGEVVIPQGTRIRPPEIGGLLALGITEVSVASRPRVGIISSGDEVIPPQGDPRPGQVRDINTYTLSGLVREAGGNVVPYGIIPDDREPMLTTLRKAHQECDLVVVTAGSSASSRDLTAELMDALGEPGVLVHGVNVKPGKPTIFAVAGEKVMIGLPGNPVSALVIASLYVVPVIEAMLGLRSEKFTPFISAELTINLSSQTGREDWIPVQLRTTPEGKVLAEPVFGKSNLIFVLVKARGLVRIPADAGGMEAGSQVRVRLL